MTLPGLGKIKFAKLIDLNVLKSLENRKKFSSAKILAFRKMFYLPLTIP